MNAYCTISSQYYTGKLSSFCWTLLNREDQAELSLIKRKGKIPCEGFFGAFYTMHVTQLFNQMWALKPAQQTTEPVFVNFNQYTKSPCS